MISLLVSVLTGVASLFLTGFISSLCVSWYHIPSREGASGYFVLFNSIGGGIAGLVIGLIAARIVAGTYGPGFLKELSAALGAVLAIAVAATGFCRWFADVPPKIDGRRLTLEVEFRFPTVDGAEESPTAADVWSLEFGSISGRTQRKSRTGTVNTDRARLESGRRILPAEVFLFTERGKRSIALKNNDQSVAGFLIPLPARPGREFEQWSDWLPRQQANGEPWPEDKMSYRFRVQKEPPPAPVKSHEEWQAEQDAKVEAEFTAIPTDAPVQSWFPYLANNSPQTERAWSIITSRPGLAEELGRFALGDDAELAGEALRCMGNHPHPTTDFIAPVEAVGRDIAERIRTFNTVSVEADPSYEGAADVSIRFSAWFTAVSTLRDKCGGDFTPELQTILELSRVRTDSHAMQADVRRVASYYLNAWAGIAPLPGDPKPR